MECRNMLALDLGASNGRCLMGRFDGSRLTVGEIARFTNDPVEDRGHLRWDIPRLYADAQAGIRKAARATDVIHSIGIDSWGVDFGLLDAAGRLMGNPRHYRDAATDGMREAAFARMEPRALYAETGNAFERYNTLFQILGMMKDDPVTVRSARHLLMIADLFLYFLTGVVATEFTAATTTQLVTAGTQRWSDTVIESMGIPRALFSEIQLPGIVRGAVTPRTAAELGTGALPVIAVAHHDTASAVAAIPSKGKGRCFLSSGTWSLIGVETDGPILDAAAQRLGYTNEGCADGGCRLLKNIMGLWILQECKRDWDSQGSTEGYDELCELAAGERPFFTMIDPENDTFFAPGGMPGRIQEYCLRTAQHVPEGKGAIVRCILESLALAYRTALGDLESLSGRRLDRLCVVGGGSRNRLLNQFTANAIKRPVMAGPEEAASIGNLIVQALALGDVDDLDEARDVVSASFSPQEYRPEDAAAWDDAYGRFRRLCAEGRAAS